MDRTSPLEALGYPLFYPVEPSGLALEPPSTSLDAAQRTRVRSLAGMQKEALVTAAPSGRTWRLASDEGEYLDGDDVAPCPLAFMTTGMISSVANALQRLATTRDIGLRDLQVVCDNYYTMTGSALRGDMTGGALAPEITVTVDTDAPDRTVETLVDDALARAPIIGLLDGELQNRFSLTFNGDSIPTGRVLACGVTDPADPAALFEAIPRRAPERSPPLGQNTGHRTEEFTGDRSGYSAGESSSLATEQDRILHLRGTLTPEAADTNRVEVKLYSPRGSIFELRSAGPVGDAETPAPLTYVAAGIGFCFMTQIGRYADIVDRNVVDYAIVQDTQFATGEGEAPGRAAPIETHLHLRSAEGPAFAREVLDMAEQTCFLHALCRTPLEPHVTVQSATAA